MKNLVNWGASQTIKNEAKEQNGGFLGMLLSTSLLDASLLGDLSTGKGTVKAGQEMICPK